MADTQEPKAPLAYTSLEWLGKAAMVAGGVALGAAVASVINIGPAASAIPIDADALGTGGEPIAITTDNWITKTIDWVKNGEFNFSERGDFGRTAALAGALGGGGYALSSLMQNKKEAAIEAQEDQAMANVQQGGFAAAEQSRAIQGLMKARLMATNPEYFAQMAGQGRGA